jgi:HEPN domain-containing protein
MIAHNRLESLWDMLQRDAAAFVDVVTTCERVNILVIGTGEINFAGQNDVLEEATHASALKHLAQLEAALADMPVKATLAAIQRTKATLKAGGVKYSELGKANADIFSRFKDELAGRNFLFLTEGESDLFEPKNPLFGEKVDQAFPTAAEDISEAGKCAGLGRYTASIFHLMRAMECAVQLLADEIGVANVEREWGKLLSDIGTAIEAMPKGKKRDQWSESHSHLYHVKQAWRNSTMHPKKTYTAEEAEAVFAAVRSFMRHLAPLIPAPGGP